MRKKTRISQINTNRDGKSREFLAGAGSELEGPGALWSGTGTVVGGDESEVVASIGFAGVFVAGFWTGGVWLERRARELIGGLKTPSDGLRLLVRAGPEQVRLAGIVQVLILTGSDPPVRVTLRK